jgi:hypothetical protein
LRGGLQPARHPLAGGSLFDHFVQQLESFLFYYIFTKTPTKDLERNLSVGADDLREIGEITDAEGALPPQDGAM